MGKDENFEGIELDPKSFEIFDIKDVPSFVLVKKNKMLKGNVDINFALEKFEVLG